MSDMQMCSAGIHLECGLNCWFLGVFPTCNPRLPTYDMHIVQHCSNCSELHYVPSIDALGDNISNMLNRALRASNHLRMTWRAMLQSKYPAYWPLWESVCLQQGNWGLFMFSQIHASFSMLFCYTTDKQLCDLSPWPFSSLLAAALCLITSSPSSSSLGCQLLLN